MDKEDTKAMLRSLRIIAYFLGVIALCEWINLFK